MTKQTGTYVLVLALILFGILLVAIRNSAPEPDRRYVAALGSTYVIVNWFTSEKALQIALGDDDLAGLSNCDLRPDFNTSFCELWLVIPTTQYDEYAFDTIGHEFYHALVGDFHE